MSFFAKPVPTFAGHALAGAWTAPAERAFVSARRVTTNGGASPTRAAGQIRRRRKPHMAGSHMHNRVGRCMRRVDRRTPDGRRTRMCTRAGMHRRMHSMADRPRHTVDSTRIHSAGSPSPRLAQEPARRGLRLRQLWLPHKLPRDFAFAVFSIRLRSRPYSNNTPL